MKIAFIIQARLTSSRLKNKILENIGEKKVLDWVIDSIKRKFDKNDVILAIPDNEENEKIAKLYEEKVKIVRGPENDVAFRFIKATNLYHPEYVIRICSDNPFIQTEFIDEIYQSILASNPDYVSHYCDDVNCILKPFGFFSEGFSVNKFKELYHKMNDYDKEHVTPIFYKYGNSAKLIKLNAPEVICNTRNIRFTLDNIEDLELYNIIYSIDPKEYFTYTDLIEAVKSNAAIREKMRNNYILGGKK